MPNDLFDAGVAKALEQLPREFLDKMQNVEILVEDFADVETLNSLGLTSRWDLLGLYVGVPLTEQSFFSINVLPERIYLYRIPISQASGGIRNLAAEIRNVLLHELGHHFGFDDSELEQMAARIK